MTKAKKQAKRRRGQSASKAMLDAIPSNWLDPLLSGPKAVIGMPPYSGPDIERLLNAVRERVRQASNDGGNARHDKA